MTHRMFIALALGAATVAAPACASYVRATYSGTVEQIGINAPAGVDVGTPISVAVVYDPSRFVDYTSAVNAFVGTSYTSVLFDSLSDDPGASLRISVGPVTFRKRDGIRYGTPFGNCDPADCGPLGLRAGNLPAVSALDGAFGGVNEFFLNRFGFGFSADPIAVRVTGGYGLDGPGTGAYAFYLGAGDLEDPYAKGYAVGSIDLSTLRIVPTPEPAALALLGIGAAAAAWAKARRRR